MGLRRHPFAFTEEGVAMLSGILRSKISDDVNIQIMRAFVAMCKFISINRQKFQRLGDIERKQIEHERNFEKIFHAIEDKSIKPVQGVFFDDQIFDAHKLICDLIKNAKEIIVIDNYVDENTLVLFSMSQAKVTIYTKNISRKLKHGLHKYNSQYKPIEIKEFNKSHDRFLVVDNRVYHFGASLKDLGKKWFAFSRIDKASLKILDMLKNGR